MNRTSIKIIKRQDAELVVSGKIRDLTEPKLVAATGYKNERSSHRKIAYTVSNWIAECRENNRAEEVSSIRRILGGESFLRNGA